MNPARPRKAGLSAGDGETPLDMANLDNVSPVSRVLQRAQG